MPQVKLTASTGAKRRKAGTGYRRSIKMDNQVELIAQLSFRNATEGHETRRAFAKPRTRETAEELLRPIQLFAGGEPIA